MLIGAPFDEQLDIFSIAPSNGPVERALAKPIKSSDGQTEPQDKR